MNHLSLFSGSGIGTLAAAACGIRTVAHAENDQACCYCLERLWPDVRLFRDVRDVTAESVADLGPIDICSGGFPCTDISTAGKGAGLGTEENPTRSGLWFEFARIIRETQPRFLLLENVPALRVRGGDRVCADLEAMGYTWETFVVGAWAVGAPHKRDRVWIVGRLDDSASDTGSRASRNCFGAIGETKGDHEKRRPSMGRLHESFDTSGNGLADPLGNLCGRGGDESERGPEGRTAAGRASEAVADAEDSERRSINEQTEAGSWRGAVPQTGRCSGVYELADRPRQPWEQRAERDGVGFRGWPSRPGEPQHAWEAPRLVEFKVGSVPDELSRRLLREAFGITDGVRDDTFDRVAQVIAQVAASKGNKAGLRAIGNAWVYECAVLMFRAIIELDGSGFDGKT